MGEMQRCSELQRDVVLQLLRTKCAYTLESPALNHAQHVALPLLMILLLQASSLAYPSPPLHLTIQWKLSSPSNHHFSALLNLCLCGSDEFCGLLMG